MATIWGIHNDVESSELIEKGFISIGWNVPDLRTIGNDRTAMKAAVQKSYPNAKPGAIPVWAGILLRFAYEMKIGDLVIAPNKPDSTLSFGRVSGDYTYHGDGRVHPHVRTVTWLRTGVSRALFSQSALYEIGSALTLFQVRSHADEFGRFLLSDSEQSFVDDRQASPQQDDEAVEAAASEDPNADRIHQFTRDFVADRLLNGMSHEDFEYFTADLLRCLGYQARVTSYVADGGVDVIAHKDPLGLEAPIIKVQCKHTVSTQSRPDVQRLIGTLSKDEVALFVTLGTYSKDARDLERGWPIRLFAGTDLVDLVMEHYKALPARWRELIPLRHILVVDRDPQAG